jgi:hypothetical protein
LEVSLFQIFVAQSQVPFLQSFAKASQAIEAGGEIQRSRNDSDAGVPQTNQITRAVSRGSVYLYYGLYTARDRLVNHS